MVIHSEILENYFFDFWIHGEIFLGGFCYYFNILADVDVFMLNFLIPIMETKRVKKEIQETVKVFNFRSILLILIME